MPPNEEFLDVQNQVFMDEIRKQHEDAERLRSAPQDNSTEDNHEQNEELRFIAENGLPFRLFAEHLTPEARAVWDRYTHGESDALSDLERAYDAFKAELIAHIHADDPKESAAFAQAIEDGDVDAASRIIALHAGFLDEEVAA